MERLAYISAQAISLFLLVTTVGAQTNLLLNPDADKGSEGWRIFGAATVEEFNGNKVFVLRSDGNGLSHFLQDVDLTTADVGKYALFIGRGSSERINADGSITGLPYLYGYMLNSKKSNGATIIEYLQGQQMLARPRVVDAWVMMYGIFKVPPGTVAIRYFLNQADRRGVPPNGSAARFDNVGLFLFSTEKEALNFSKSYYESQ